MSTKTFPKEVASRSLVLVRWWFGLTWILAGTGGIVAGPIMLARGNAGGVYMLIGAAILIACGWAILPEGLQRRRMMHQQGN